MTFLTNQELVEIYNNRMYDLFDIPFVRFSNLLDAEPIDASPNYVIEVLKTRKHPNPSYFREIRREICVRIGNPLYKEKLMFTYGQDLVPVSLRLYQKDNEFKFVFNASTIDDASSFFLITSNSKEEMEKFFDYSKEFLNQYTYFPNAEIFENFFMKYGVPLGNFDYN